MAAQLAASQEGVSSMSEFAVDSSALWNGVSNNYFSFILLLK
jgi:hypothetical protein